MAGLRTVRASDVEDFLSRAGGFLAAREAEHNLLFGICSNLRATPEAYGEPPYLATVEADGGVVAAAALRTPPYNIVLSEVDESSLAAAVASLADDVATGGARLPGVLAATHVARAFASAWRERTGARVELGLRERIFQLRAVRPVPRASGQMRLADLGDRDLLVRWLDAFWREALGETETGDAAAAVDRWLGGAFRTVYLWDDDAAVSMAAAGGTTPNGIRIGPVYTPPEFRRRGYATTLVAQVTQAQLDAGHRFCFLFTDLANPTSNHIYREIGYEPVSDVEEYRFAT